MTPKTDRYAVAEARYRRLARRIFASDLRPRTKHVLVTIAHVVSGPGRSRPPSVAELAPLTSLSERTVRRHLRLAEEAGWLRAQEDGRRVLVAEEPTT